MNVGRRAFPFILIVLSAILVLGASIWDISSNAQWSARIILLYLILVTLAALLLVSRRNEPSPSLSTEDFEAALKGQLQHFKCPSCGGIFAVKKSRHNNKKDFVLTCPDCSLVGLVPRRPMTVLEKIPEKKSRHKNFVCQNCGGALTVWAEGKDLSPVLRIYSCPYCGAKQTMHPL
jgi:predicted RNA-binding Zn-ribbon protein involved in translation (DUF1610 family)